jgi:hypothetical protein
MARPIPTDWVSGTYGVWIGADHPKRPKTKMELKRAVTDDSANVFIEDMSLTGTATPGGQVIFAAFDIPIGKGYRTIVGPDPYNKRIWYASIERTDSAHLRVK